MLERGRWIAEAPWVKGHAGFHLSALYSPVGWYSWTTAVKKRLEADKDPSKKLLKTWTNTVLAEPYADEGDKVSDLVLKERALGDAQRPATASAPCRASRCCSRPRSTCSTSASRSW
jgi:hypothetical protein